MRQLAAVLRLLPRRDRARFAWGVAIATVVAALDVVATLVVAATVASVVVSPATDRPSSLPGALDRLVTTPSSPRSLALVLMGVLVVRGVAYIAQHHVMARAAEGGAFWLSTTLQRRYLEQPYEWHLTHPPSELLRTSWDSVTTVRSAVLLQTGTIVADTLLVAGLGVVLVVLDPVLACVAVVTLGLAFGLSAIAVQPRLRRVGQDRNDVMTSVIDGLHQPLVGIREVKSAGRVSAFADRYRTARAGLVRANVSMASLGQVPRVVIELAFMLLLLVVLVLAGSAGTTTLVSDLGAFAYAALRIQPAAQRLAVATNALRFADAAVESVRADLELGRSGRAEDERTGDAAAPATDPFPALEFRSVGYRYPGATAFAVRDVSISVPQGTSLGIVGTSGAGKSTLLDLLTGLLEPTEGSVRVMGVPPGAIPPSSRRGVYGIVHQRPYFIDDSVATNVRFLDALDDDRVRLDDALALAGIADDVAAMPLGVGSPIGGGGTGLSGGQGQRVALARALYGRPALLVLDEGTANLDQETERRVMAAVRSLDQTLVVVAHRMETVRACDRIVLVEAGAIVAQGSFDELYETEPGFRRLASGPT